jgi:hypothetical protein
MRLTDDEYNALISRRQARLIESPESNGAKKAIGQSRREPKKQIIRQSRKGLNKTEARFLNEQLKPMLACGFIDEIGEHESIRLKLANGLTYKPDFPTWAGDKLTFYEVKGERMWEDALKSLKVAAHQYRRFRFYLYKYVKGEWTWQEVLP